MKKDDIRRTVRARKSLLTENEKAEAAQSVFDRLEQMAAFMMADRILMYHSLPDELSTRDFLGKWSGRKHFFLPRVNGVNLDILLTNRPDSTSGLSRSRNPTAMT